ncbi:MAG: nitrate ABC transporter, permease protein, partial [Candidatus Afipia apatlaquensis]|nr:nitrate ABC transporter, permease protein [Candidatus Afipia apatlaquensis]
MNMPLAKTTSTLPTPAPASSAAVVPLPKSSRSFLTDALFPNLRALAARVVPPFIMLVLIFGV